MPTARVGARAAPAWGGLRRALPESAAGGMRSVKPGGPAGSHPVLDHSTLISTSLLQGRSLRTPCCARCGAAPAAATSACGRPRPSPTIAAPLTRWPTQSGTDGWVRGATRLPAFVRPTCRRPLAGSACQAPFLVCARRQRRPCCLSPPRPAPSLCRSCARPRRCSRGLRLRSRTSDKWWLARCRRGARSCKPSMGSSAAAAGGARSRQSPGRTVPGRAARKAGALGGLRACHGVPPATQPTPSATLGPRQVQG
jgi:hypothetical protein